MEAKAFLKRKRMTNDTLSPPFLRMDQNSSTLECQTCNKIVGFCFLLPTFSFRYDILPLTRNHDNTYVKFDNPNSIQFAHTTLAPTSAFNNRFVTRFSCCTRSRLCIAN